MNFLLINARITGLKRKRLWNRVTNFFHNNYTSIHQNHVHIGMTLSFIDNLMLIYSGINWHMEHYFLCRIPSYQVCLRVTDDLSPHPFPLRIAGGNFKIYVCHKTLVFQTKKVRFWKRGKYGQKKILEKILHISVDVT